MRSKIIHCTSYYSIKKRGGKNTPLYLKRTAYDDEFTYCRFLWAAALLRRLHGVNEKKKNGFLKL